MILQQIRPRYWFLLRAVLIKNRVICGISKCFVFPSPCQEKHKGIFLDVYCGDQVKLLPVNLGIEHLLPPTGPCWSYYFSELRVLRLQQFVISVQVSYPLTGSGVVSAHGSLW